MFLTSVIAYVIPDMPSHLQEKHHREKYLVNNIIIETERKIAQGEHTPSGENEIRRLRLRSRSCDEPEKNGSDVRKITAQCTTTNV
jgi:hypothetical protein